MRNTPMRPASLPDHATHHPSPRRGVITLWSLFALMVCGACAALVINQLWINAVRGDALRCAEAAALAAGHRLLSDDMLRPHQGEFEQQGRINRSQMAALELCKLYRQSALIPALQASDIRYQQLPPSSGDLSQSRSSGQGPERVIVGYRAGEATFRIPLFLGGLTGVRDVAIGVEASVQLDHTPAGFQPAPLISVPMMPFCLPDDDGLTGAESWSLRIEKQPKSDRFSWVEERRVVESGADGLPEITLTLTSGRPAMTCETLVPLQLCSDPFGNRAFLRQLSSGITSSDLASVGLQQIRFPQSVGTCSIPPRELDELAGELARLTGRELLWCLIDVNAKNDVNEKSAAASEDSAENAGTESNASSTDGAAAGSKEFPDRVTLSRPVAARILNVRMRSKQQIHVTLQPCVLATVTAIMESERPINSRYVYRVRLVQ